MWPRSLFTGITADECTSLTQTEIFGGVLVLLLRLFFNKILHICNLLIVTTLINTLFQPMGTGKQTCLPHSFIKGNHYAVFTRCDNGVAILSGRLPLFSPSG